MIGIPINQDSVQLEGHTGSSSYPMPSREKYWSELTSYEKIERMRTQVKYRDYLIDDMQKKLNKLEQFFYKHQHCERTAKVLVEPNQYEHITGGGLLGAKYDSGSQEVYF